MKHCQYEKDAGLFMLPTEEPRLAQPSAELPTAYGQTRLTLLDVDPFRVHAAWELTPHDRAAAEKKCPGAFNWVLRFYDERDGSMFDIPVEPEVRRWYVELWTADKTYHAELGLYSAQGDFAGVCQSNTITTPPAAPAPLQALQWLAVSGALEQAQVVSAPQGEPSAVCNQPAAAAVEGEPALAAALETAAQDFPLAPPPNAEVVTSIESVEAHELPAAVAAVLEEKAMEGAVPAVAPAPGCSSATVSSFSMGGGAEKAAIELELNAEIVVYGRAQPGQTLRVNGRPVTINDDGTFHVRWALPVAKP